MCTSTSLKYYNSIWSSCDAEVDIIDAKYCLEVKFSNLSKIHGYLNPFKSWKSAAHILCSLLVDFVVFLIQNSLNNKPNSNSMRQFGSKNFDFDFLWSNIVFVIVICYQVKVKMLWILWREKKNEKNFTLTNGFPQYQSLTFCVQPPSWERMPSK